jgi:LPXTG-site transpeptidase (sortase) family protein
VTQLQPLDPPEHGADADVAAVVDLREAAPQPLPARADEGAPSSVPEGRGRAKRRWIIVFVVVGLVGAFFLEQAVGQITHQSRQHHLAYEFGQPAPQVRSGEALLDLQIPAIGLNEIVSQGASAAALRSGPGHVEGTADIGGKGNAVLLGRRERYGGPFARLHQLEKGDRIAVQTRQSQVRNYRVTSVKHVPNSSSAPVAPTKRERLTLVTSDAGWVPSGRVVVVAEPVSAAPIRGAAAKGGPVSAGTLDQRPATLPLGLVVWLCVGLLIGLVVVAARELHRRYSTSVLLIALAPVTLVLFLIAVYSLDLVLASTV